MRVSKVYTVTYTYIEIDVPLVKKISIKQTAKNTKVARDLDYTTRR